jgi:hypothetical protein
MTSPEQLAAADRAYVVAAAGCGKTRLIIDAVDHDRTRRHLILTHTHAGVEVVRRRLRERRIRDDRAHVTTLAGFAFRYAAGYPQRSALPSTHPRDEEYQQVVRGAADVLATRAVRGVIAQSYGSVFVDEYQDCTALHHTLLRRLADILPTRILGDPFQSIFDFGHDRPVPWGAVTAEFTALPELQIPHRWASTNPALGRWLGHARTELIADRPLGYRSPALHHIDLSIGGNPRGRLLAACKRLSTRPSVVVLVRQANAAHHLASQLGGAFTSMEELACDALDAAASRLDAADGVTYADTIVELAAKQCFTRVAKHLKRARDALKAGYIPAAGTRGVAAAATTAIHHLANEPTPLNAVTALREIAQLPDATLYRAELYDAMIRTLHLAGREPGLTMRDAAWTVRDHTRHHGRRISGPVVSRTLLAKGLEFDHAIVFADDFADSPRDLYVALTRPRQTLTVITGSKALSNRR